MNTYAGLRVVESEKAGGKGMGSRKAEVGSRNVKAGEGETGKHLIYDL